MNRFISVYHAHFHIFTVFGSANHVRFDFQAVRRGGETVTEISAAVIENILYGFFHFLFQQLDE